MMRGFATGIAIASLMGACAQGTSSIGGIAELGITELRIERNTNEHLVVVGTDAANLEIARVELRAGTYKAQELDDKQVDGRLLEVTLMGQTMRYENFTRRGEVNLPAPPARAWDFDVLLQDAGVKPLIARHGIAYQSRSEVGYGTAQHCGDSAYEGSASSICGGGSYSDVAVVVVNSGFGDLFDELPSQCAQYPEVCIFGGYYQHNCCTGTNNYAYKACGEPGSNPADNPCGTPGPDGCKACSIWPMAGDVCDLTVNGSCVDAEWQNTDINTNGIVNHYLGGGYSAHRGQYIQLWGYFNDSTPSSSTTVTVGGVGCTVTYRSTNQINCLVSNSTPLGYQAVTLTDLAGSDTEYDVYVYPAP